jgi:hypothetical protein
LNLNFGNLTSTVRGLWEELVEKRLWPVAIALVVALVALPVVLSKSAAEAPAPPPATPAVGGPSSPLAAFQPAVTTDGKKSDQIRKNLGHFRSKNPFSPKGSNFTSSSTTGTASVATGSASGLATVNGQTTVTGGSESSTSTGTSGSPAPAAPTGSTGSPTKSTSLKYYTYTVKVRFGKVGQADAKTLTQFRALPSSDDPIVVFMGVRDDGKTAVFLVSAAATATGDGNCQPSGDQCTFLYMKKGDKEALEAVGQDNQVIDYELELRDVSVKKTSGPTKANASRSKHSGHKFRNRARSKHAAHSSRANARLKRSVRTIQRLGF